MPAGQAVSLPWWDWSAQTGIPASYAAPDLPGGGPNPRGRGRVGAVELPAGPVPTLNVGQTLSITALGYQYAAATSSAAAAGGS